MAKKKAGLQKSANQLDITNIQTRYLSETAAFLFYALASSDALALFADRGFFEVLAFANFSQNACFLTLLFEASDGAFKRLAFS